MKNTIEKAWVLAAIFIVVTILNIPPSMARLTGTPASGTQDDIVAWGPDGAEIAINVDGDLVPTTTNDTTLGTSSLEWADLRSVDATFSDDVIISDDLAVSGAATVGETLVVTGVLSADSGIDFGVDSYLLRKSSSITLAEVLALNGQGVELIVAPGADKAIIVHYIIVKLDYNSTAYDGVAGNEDLKFSYTDKDGVEIVNLETTGFIDQSNSEFRVIYPITTAAGEAGGIVFASNAPLVISLTTAEIATGNSPIDFVIYYSVVATDF